MIYDIFYVCVCILIPEQKNDVRLINQKMKILKILFPLKTFILHVLNNYNKSLYILTSSLHNHSNRLVLTIIIAID